MNRLFIYIHNNKNMYPLNKDFHNYGAHSLKNVSFRKPNLESLTPTYAGTKICSFLPSDLKNTKHICRFENWLCSQALYSIQEFINFMGRVTYNFVLDKYSTD